LAALATAVVLPWTLTFLFGGERVVGRSRWEALSMTRLDPALFAEV